MCFLRWGKSCKTATIARLITPVSFVQDCKVYDAQADNSRRLLAPLLSAQSTPPTASVWSQPFAAISWNGIQHIRI
jgi:hypothetical protein